MENERKVGLRSKKKRGVELNQIMRLVNSFPKKILFIYLFLSSTKFPLFVKLLYCFG